MLVSEKRWEALSIPTMCDGLGVGARSGVSLMQAVEEYMFTCEAAWTNTLSP
jgi:hypothetical protein